MSNKMNDIKKFSDAVQEQFAADRTLLSFSEYLEIVAAEPHKHLRSSAQYLVDLFDFYGTTELQHPTGNTTRYKLFDMPFNQGENKVIKVEFYIIIAEFYSKDSANLLKKRITQELKNFDTKKLYINSRKSNKITLLSGPYSSINLMKNDYIQLKKFGFEELDITINE